MKAIALGCSDEHSFARLTSDDLLWADGLTVQEIREIRIMQKVVRRHKLISYLADNYTPENPAGKFSLSPPWLPKGLEPAAPDPVKPEDGPAVKDTDPDQSTLTDWGELYEQS